MDLESTSAHPDREAAPSPTSEALAHLDISNGAPRPHPLADHLGAVADLAARFGEPLQSAAAARLAGLWHDLGKYARGFQSRIRRENGVEAHLEGPSTGSGARDHSSAGAVHASHFGEAGVAIAFAIAGHHGGLADFAELKGRLEKKASLFDGARRDGAPASLLDQPHAGSR